MFEAFSLPRECWRFWLLVAIVGIPLFVAAQDMGAGKPVVHEPIMPKVQETDLNVLIKGKTVKPWKPGDPVRVMEDLKEDTQECDLNRNSQAQGPRKPAVREPITPRVTEKKLEDLPDMEPYKPSDSVRIMKDLRETSKSEPTEEMPGPAGEKSVSEKK